MTDDISVTHGLIQEETGNCWLIQFNNHFEIRIPII